MYKDFQNGLILGMALGGVNEMSVDQIFNPDSENAQSGKAVAEAVATIKVPSVYSYSTARLTNQKVFENEVNSPSVLTIKAKKTGGGSEWAVGISFELFLAKKENEETIQLINHPFRITIDENGKLDIEHFPIISLIDASYMIDVDGSLVEYGYNTLKTVFVDGETFVRSENEIVIGNYNNAVSFEYILWLYSSSEEVADAFKEEFEALFQAADSVNIYYTEFAEKVGG